MMGCLCRARTGSIEEAQAQPRLRCPLGLEHQRVCFCLVLQRFPQPDSGPDTLWHQTSPSLGRNCSYPNRQQQESCILCVKKSQMQTPPLPRMGYGLNTFPIPLERRSLKHLVPVPTLPPPSRGLCRYHGLLQHSFTKGHVRFLWCPQPVPGQSCISSHFHPCCPLAAADASLASRMVLAGAAC